MMHKNKVFKLFCSLLIAWFNFKIQPFVSSHWVVHLLVLISCFSCVVQVFPEPWWTTTAQVTSHHWKPHFQSSIIKITYNSLNLIDYVLLIFLYRKCSCCVLSEIHYLWCVIVSYFTHIVTWVLCLKYSSLFLVFCLVVWIHIVLCGKSITWEI